MDRVGELSTIRGADERGSIFERLAGGDKAAALSTGGVGVERGDTLEVLSPVGQLVERGATLGGGDRVATVSDTVGEGVTKRSQKNTYFNPKIWIFCLNEGISLQNIGFN